MGVVVVTGALVVTGVALALVSVAVAVGLGAFVGDRAAHRRWLTEVERAHGAGAAQVADAEFIALRRQRFPRALLKRG